MKKDRKLLLTAAVFSFLCLLGYLLRQDYFHKQLDQFYYLSCADNLWKTGQLHQLINLTEGIPPTANTGVTWLMFPFAKLSFHWVFALLSVIHFFLHISTVSPLQKTLRAFGLPEKQVDWTLTLFFTAFPITLLSLMPINEGMSFFLCAWFFFFVFVKRSTLGVVLTAAFAPLFRAHILILEISLIAWALISRRKRETRFGIEGLVASLAGLRVYQAFFPFEQAALGGPLKEPNVVTHLLSGLGESTAYLFLPETIFQKALGGFAAAGATFVGLALWFALVGALVYSVKKAPKEQRPLAKWALVTLALSTVALFGSLVIRSRFYVTGFLPMLIGAAIFVHAKFAGWAERIKLGFVGANAVFLAAFLFTGTTSPIAVENKNLEKLSRVAQDSPVVYYDQALPQHERQIYGVFRRPSVKLWMTKVQREKAVILAGNAAAAEKELRGCRYDKHVEGGITLFNADCSERKIP